MSAIKLTPQDLAQAAKLIQNGQLVAFPTETVYGLGADATNEAAVKKVYQAKGRPSDNPLIVHVANPATVSKYAEFVPVIAKQLMNQFWPGPLTIILPIKREAFSKTVTGGLNTVAFRMPDNQTTLNLIDLAGVPLVGPSANTSGKPSPTTADHVLHDLEDKIAAVVDDGPTKIGLESTVIDLSVTPPIILRPGAITQETLTKTLGNVLENHGQVKANEIPKAPGMKYKHYAPNAQVLIVNSESDMLSAVHKYEANNQPYGIMATDELLSKLLPYLSQGESFSLGYDVETASHALFDGLRFFDNHQVINVILAQGFSEEGYGDAYMNRLKKAAGNQFFNK